jgi:TRAP-type C4-dicarboxylate transport system permease small subunit
MTTGRDLAESTEPGALLAWAMRLLSGGAFLADLLAGLLLGILAIVVLLQIFSRYVLRAPIFWTIDGATILLVWVSFLGAATASFRRAHFAMEFVADALPAPLGRWISIIANLLVVLILVELAVVGWQFAMLQMDQMYPSIQMPKGLAAAAIPLSAALMIPRYLIDALMGLGLFRTARRRSDG